MQILTQDAVPCRGCCSVCPDNFMSWLVPSLPLSCCRKSWWCIHVHSHACSSASVLCTLLHKHSARLLARRGQSCQKLRPSIRNWETETTTQKNTEKRQNMRLQSQNSSGRFKHSLDCSTSTTSSYCTEQQALKPFVAFSTGKLYGDKLTCMQRSPRMSSSYWHLIQGSFIWVKRDNRGLHGCITVALKPFWVMHSRVGWRDLCKHYAIHWMKLRTNG